MSEPIRVLMVEDVKTDAELAFYRGAIFLPAPEAPVPQVASKSPAP